ncbi:phage antirepressor N-terminal domain-containing protein [Haemophilus seminalis]|uniref:phage antirepressor N-terminal domain-containing protein n=1 Tax=Haemophilus seminalis TaxID=2582921 RepID=UPI002552E108|nr:phage antirepressor N-terminal domain-containing protein [Haemophilus seminalis]MDK7281557.1 phage antirepressor N-terminal domain-containing protein [Haemophilus seminalis]
MTTQIQTIQFNHQSLVTFEQNGTHYTAMKPICENIGLCWDGQRQRIQRDEVLSEGAVIITVPSNGGDQQMICLPIEYINGWLFGIDIKRCKPEIRETLIMYKKECYQALYNYWNKPQQLALPEPEKKYTFEFTEYELQQLIWLWFAFKRGIGTFQHIERAFNVLGSNMSGQIYGQAYEYLSVLRSTNQILNRITSDFNIDPMTNWRILKHLRGFNPKAVKIDF